MLRLRLPPRDALVPNNDVDPFRFYYRPLIGRIFIARIDLGLRLLDGRFHRLLEVGYGSGLLMPTLSTHCDELYGVDLEREPPQLRSALERLGARPSELAQADIRSLPFASGHFDGVVAFSILEHLGRAALDEALRELARVLEPGGRLLIGIPAVHSTMNAAFRAIGFRDIGHHHLSGIADVLAAAKPYFVPERQAALPHPVGNLLPLGWAPYTAVLLRKRPSAPFSAPAV